MHTRFPRKNSSLHRTERPALVPTQAPGALGTPGRRLAAASAPALVPRPTQPSTPCPARRRATRRPPRPLPAASRACAVPAVSPWRSRRRRRRECGRRGRAGAGGGCRAGAGAGGGAGPSAGRFTGRRRLSGRGPAGLRRRQRAPRPLLRPPASPGRSRSLCRAERREVRSARGCPCSAARSAHAHLCVRNGSGSFCFPFSRWAPQL